MKAIASTKINDVWVLFAHGIGVNRMLEKNFRIAEGSRSRLNKVFGTDRWESEFYKVEERTSLFEDNRIIEQKKKNAIEHIRSFYNRRLKLIFEEVLDEPLVLRNSKGSAMYSLCYAIGNKKGARIGKGIAESLIRKYNG